MLATALMLALVVAAPSTQSAATVTQIRVQGNVATSDDEVLRLAGVQAGMPVGDDTVAEVAARLRRTGRFERVEVLKRFASISDPTQIALVIIVDEGRVHVEMTGDPNRPTRVVRDRGPNFLFLPILDAEDGYGLAYGVRITLQNPAGARSRLSAPLSWGGHKQAGLEFDKTVDDAPISRILASASIDGRENPFFHEDDDRVRASVRVERSLTKAARVGATGGWQRVSFAGQVESFSHAGVDVVLDTRIDPVLARNAVYARASAEHLNFGGGGANRVELEGRGYIGLVGQTVLVVRAQRSDADQALPPYLKPLLGGTANVRGFRFGTAAGDTLVAASLELLVPLTSPLKFGKVGVSAFTDVGTVYDKGQRLSDQTLRRGVGGGVWFSAAFVRLSLAVAHGVGASTRVHFGGGVSF